MLSLASVVVSLAAFQLPAISSELSPTHTIQLRTSDFQWFSTSSPGAIQLNGSSWLLPEPQTTPPQGHLAVDDSKTVSAYSLDKLSFSTLFPLENGSLGGPCLFGDEMVIFAASDTTAYQGFEFGVRDSLQTNQVYAYYQFPLADGLVEFHETPLFVNDAHAHSYVIQLSGPLVLFSVDGALVSQGFYPNLPPSEFQVVATAHRASGGWTSTGLALAVLSVDAEVRN